MSVVNAVPGWTGRGGSQSSPDGKSWQESRTVPYTILVDNPADGEDTVLASLPPLGSYLPGTPWFRCVNRNVKQVGPVYWEADVEYSSESEPGKSPVDTAPRFRWYTIPVEEPIDRDFDGKAITTVNGEPIEGLTRTFRVFVLEITRNLSSFDPTAMINFIDTTNSDTFLGCSPGQLYLADISADEVVGNDSVYFTARCQIHLRRAAFGASLAQTWHKRVLHAGYKVRVGTPEQGIMQMMGLDETGSTQTKPLLLKADGSEETNPSNAHYLFKKIYGTSAFGSLGII